MEEDGANPLKLSEVERRLYVEGPQGLLELDNSVLYVVNEKDRLEKLLEKAGFKVNEKIEKKETQSLF